MNEIFSDSALATASGVALIDNGKIVEFFPRAANGKDLGLSGGDEFVLTEAEEAELAAAIEDFIAKIKVSYQKMDASQARIDELRNESVERQKRIDAALEKIEGMFAK